MAIIRGGLHGRPSGNVAGVVYGAARTRQGKAVTARELVFPSNPQTPAQVLQRQIFFASMHGVRSVGPDMYQDDWNRSVGQLPGFQSLISILMMNTDASNELSAPDPTPLGNLHFPDTFTIVTGAGAAGSIQLDWTGELGDNGTNNDVLRGACWRVAVTASGKRGGLYIPFAKVRSDLSVNPVVGSPSIDMVVVVWFEGAGVAEDLLSQAKWYEVTTHA